jgi:hypothetical protein
VGEAPTYLPRAERRRTVLRAWTALHSLAGFHLADQLVTRPPALFVGVDVPMASLAVAD